jgi:hypothetical protein
MRFCRCDALSLLRLKIRFVGLGLLRVSFVFSSFRRVLKLLQTLHALPRMSEAAGFLQLFSHHQDIWPLQLGIKLALLQLCQQQPPTTCITLSPVRQHQPRRLVVTMMWRPSRLRVHLHRVRSSACC